MSRGSKHITRHGVTTTRACRQPKGVGPNGRPFCRWCHREIESTRRRKWCSDECVEAFRLECHPAYLRSRVEKRDKGVCAECGVNTLDAWWWWRRIRAHHGFSRDIHIALREIGWPDFSRSWWDADHIVAVVRGGPNTIENMQTLCVPCHKADTARLAADRAAERRAPLFAEEPS